MVMGILALLSALIGVVICVCCGAFESLTWLWMLPVCWLGTLLGIALLIFLFVLLLCALVDPEKEQEKDNKFYRFVVGMIADAAHTVLRVRVHAKGMERSQLRDGFCWCATI